MPSISESRFSRRDFVRTALAAVPLRPRFPNQSIGWTSQVEAALEKLFTEEMAKERIPGISVAIVLDNELKWSRGFGFADLENRVAATSQTVFRIASVSKPITATAAMQLYQRGKLDLDVPIQRYVPGFPEKPWPITARHLLEHTSGIRHYKPEEDVSRRRYQSLTEALEPFKNDPLLFETGTTFRYTSYGFVLLGAVIEGASAMTYPEYVGANIVKPCGMNSTRPDDPDAIIANRAHGYRRDASGALVNSTWVDQSNKLPAGGWLSTVEDLGRFAAAIQNGTLLEPKTKAEMWTRVRTKDGREMDYSKGWMTRREGDRIAAAGHGGNQQGTTAVLNIDPRRNLATMILMNLETYRGIWDLNGRVGQIV
jgi:serine beta-lactamase-like protein LACTB, mitochondrial